MTEETPHADYDSYLRWTKARADVIPSFDSDDRDKMFTVIISRAPGAGGRALGHEVAAYLNAVDPVAAGCWAAFDEKAIDEIATRRLKTGREETDGRPAAAHRPASRVVPFAAGRGSGGGGGGDPSARDRMLSSLSEAGATVLVDNEAHRLTLDNARVFHVRMTGSEPAGTPASEFHLAVNTARMSEETAVRVIADSALEWALQTVREK